MTLVRILEDKIQNHRLFRDKTKYFTLTGRKVKIKYEDQNEDFKTILPVTGFLTEKIKIENGIFHVVSLDHPIKYENRSFEKIMIRERHLGKVINEKTDVDIHLLLPKTKIDKEIYKLDQFDHVAWGSIRILEK